MIMMCTYFDIMSDTTGYGGQTVSPLFHLNRTNDNVLLYNPLHSTVWKCWCHVKASPKHYKKYHCISRTTVRFAHFPFKIFSVIHWVRQLYLHCKKYRAIISAVSTEKKMLSFCSPYRQNCIHFIWFELFKTIEILYDMCKIMRSTILNHFVFMDMRIIKRNKDTE